MPRRSAPAAAIGAEAVQPKSARLVTFCGPSSSLESEEPERDRSRGSALPLAPMGGDTGARVAPGPSRPAWASGQAQEARSAICTNSGGERWL